MRRVYQVASLVFLAVGAYVMLEARALQYYTEMGPGPGFFPFWLGLAFSGLAVVWCAQVTLNPVEKVEGFIPERHGAIRMVTMLLATLLLVAFVEVVGFQLMALAFLLFLLLGPGRQHAVLAVVISLAGSFGLAYVFGHWLDVQLPESSIEFLRDSGL